MKRKEKVFFDWTIVLIKKESLAEEFSSEKKHLILPGVPFH